MIEAVSPINPEDILVAQIKKVYGTGALNTITDHRLITEADRGFSMSNVTHLVKEAIMNEIVRSMPFGTLIKKGNASFEVSIRNIYILLKDTDYGRVVLANAINELSTDKISVSFTDSPGETCYETISVDIKAAAFMSISYQQLNGIINYLNDAINAPEDTVFAFEEPVYSGQKANG